LLTAFDSYYGDLGHAYPSGDDNCIIGLCTGQLASAAVSSSKTVGELISVGVPTVVLALRLGMCVLKVQGLIEPSKSAASSWSVLVSGMREPEAQDLIEQYAKKNVSVSLVKETRLRLISSRHCRESLSLMSAQSALMGLLSVVRQLH
jgi:naphtho-gamma-pyrone polyketide synthase